MTIRFLQPYKKYTLGQIVTLPTKVEFTLVKEGIAEPDTPGSDFSQAVVLSSGLVMSEVTPYVNRTTSGVVFSGPCELAGYDCTAVTGNPTITIYDNTAASGIVIVPATVLTVGRVEFEYKRFLNTGCYVVLSGTQTVNILVG